MSYRETIIRLPLIREASGEKIRTPQDVEKVCGNLRNVAQEVFCVLCLNARNVLIDKHVITLGIIDASLVHAREIFREAISLSSAAVVLAHNHPSGDPSASQEDIKITKQMIEAGRILSIPVLDHVILGDKYLSMREESICRF